jgi:K+-sensing histidine kinase KdpD
LFDRAVANLIRNAISHSAAGSEVHISLELEPTVCSIVVRDRGTPFDPTNPARMFDARGQVSAKTELAGRYSRGLGLLIARIAADASGATIEAKPSPEPFRNAFALRFKRS